jgi:hypothetical protein
MDGQSKHIKEEETDDLLALEKALKSAHSEDMAKFVPSLSHPTPPQTFVPLIPPSAILVLTLAKPPFDTVTGLYNSDSDQQIGGYVQGALR